MKRTYTDFQISMDLSLRSIKMKMHMRTPAHKLGALIAAICTAIPLALWLLT